MIEKSKMSDRFHDWLAQCPVVWHRIEHDKTGASYKFYEDDEDRASYKNDEDRTNKISEED